MQDIAADGDGAHACAADELTDNDHVHDVVYGLQGVGYKQRESELKQQPRHVAACEIFDHGGAFGVAVCHVVCLRKKCAFYPNFSIVAGKAQEKK